MATPLPTLNGQNLPSAMRIGDLAKITGKTEGQPYVGDLYPGDPPVR